MRGQPNVVKAYGLEGDTEDRRLSIFLVVRFVNPSFDGSLEEFAATNLARFIDAHPAASLRVLRFEGGALDRFAGHGIESISLYANDGVEDQAANTISTYLRTPDSVWVLSWQGAGKILEQHFGTFAKFLGAIDVEPIYSLEKLNTDTASTTQDLIAGMIADCGEIVEKSTGRLEYELETVGCTMSHEGKVSLVGGVGLTGDPLLALKSALHEIHDMSSFRAIAHFSRIPFQLDDGRDVEAVKIHVETDTAVCLELMISLDESDQPILHQAVDISARCVFWE